MACLEKTKSFLTPSSPSLYIVSVNQILSILPGIFLTYLIPSTPIEHVWVPSDHSMKIFSNYSPCLSALDVLPFSFYLPFSKHTHLYVASLLTHLLGFPQHRQWILSSAGPWVPCSVWPLIFQLLCVIFCFPPMPALLNHASVPLLWPWNLVSLFCFFFKSSICFKSKYFKAWNKTRGLLESFCTHLLPVHSLFSQAISQPSYLFF